MIDFGGGSCSSCCSCDRGKTKSTPSPFDLDWNGLGLEFDKILAKKALLQVVLDRYGSPTLDEFLKEGCVIPSIKSLLL